MKDLQTVITPKTAVAAAAIALGVSALGKSSRTTTVMWLMLWLFISIPASAPKAPDWLRRASFSQDLSTVRLEIFNLSTTLGDAAKNLPMLNDQIADSLKKASARAESTDFNGALGSLAAFCALSSFVFLRRIRAE